MRMNINITAPIEAINAMRVARWSAKREAQFTKLVSVYAARGYDLHDARYRAAEHMAVEDSL